MADLFSPDRAWTITAGLAGALLPLVFQTGLTKREVFAQPIVGTTAVVFVAPYLCERLDMTSSAAQSVTGFIVGLLALRVAQWLMLKAPEILTALIGKKTGG